VYILFRFTRSCEFIMQFKNINNILNMTVQLIRTSNIVIYTWLMTDVIEIRINCYKR